MTNPSSEAQTYSGSQPRSDTDGRSRAQALMTRMAAGDESALAALYDGWADRIHTVALGLLGDPDEADEVVADTFWQAWTSAAEYSGARGAVATWLGMMARSRALDRLRGSRRRRDATAAATADDPTTSEQPATRSIDPRVAAALNELPIEQRQVVELAFYGGFTRTEMAAATGLPIGTIKTRLRLAMGKLRCRLAPTSEDCL